GTLIECLPELIDTKGKPDQKQRVRHHRSQGHGQRVHTPSLRAWRRTRNCIRCPVSGTTRMNETVRLTRIAAASAAISEPYIMIPVAGGVSSSGRMRSRSDEAVS